MNKKNLIIGSRGSDLALWQANHIKDTLQKFGIASVIQIIKTQGDKIQHLNFDKLEGKGFFTKEIEDSLLANEIDLAVHSHKDMPTQKTPGLIIAAVSEREDCRDCIYIHPKAADLSRPLHLKENAIVATSSARRKSQILMLRPDLNVINIRGNVPTRLNKAISGECDAVILALAGVKRLKLSLEKIVEFPLSISDVVPAPAQGVLALQTRDNDYELIALLQKINCSSVQDQINLERLILAGFDGGCQLPLGVYANSVDNAFKISISKSNSWDKAPMRFKFNVTNETEIPPIISSIKNLKNKSVFISTEKGEFNIIEKSFIDNNVNFFSKSLINREALPEVKLPNFDWVFFSSKFAVKVFHKIYGNPKTKIAAIGNGTASEAKNTFGRVDFNGGELDSLESSKLFFEQHQVSSVIFPLSNKSKKNILKNIPPEVEFFEFELYSTNSIKNVEAINHDVLVFTSPSNAKSYFSNNPLNSHQQVIALGNTTAKELKELGISTILVSENNTQLSLLEKIYSTFFYETN